jgi:glycosyltransferase involved in cell wall biosynthesis
MRGITQKDFANFLKDSFVSVWVDSESAFGTFPLESMITGTPVIGKIPSLKPDWMTENNGVWTHQFNEIVDILSSFTQNWLEDNISENLYDEMSNTAKEFQNRETYETNIVTLFDSYFTKRLELFSEQLEKIKVEQ